jgi:hypothetical protein
VDEFQAKEKEKTKSRLKGTPGRGSVPWDLTGVWHGIWEFVTVLAVEAREVENEKRVLGSAEDEERALGSILASRPFSNSRFLAMTVALLIRSFNVSFPVMVGINGLRILRLRPRR